MAISNTQKIIDSLFGAKESNRRRREQRRASAKHAKRARRAILLQLV